MRVALAQVCSTQDPAANLALVRDAVREGAGRGSDLIVLPEATMASFDRRSSEVAEPADGPWATAVVNAAAEHGVSVIVGMFTQAPDGRVRNTLLATGPSGTVTYDKLHLYDAYGFRESDHIAPGDRPVLFDVGGVRVGLAVCYDVRFPDLFTHYARAGADVMVVSASWGPGPRKVDQWRTLAVARALDSTSYVVACGQASFESVGRSAAGSAPTGVGHSMVVAPQGEIMKEAIAGPDLLVVDVDLAQVAEARRVLPVLANGRFASSLGREAEPLLRSGLPRAATR
ncbi:MAG TPA: carbon-nitrogen hydrolase family protein [Propionibacteriaceae bacterium]|nr:carbon-nitrogen hydrolase family protein [Propionibacteriaceae bacterium]